MASLVIIFFVLALAYGFFEWLGKKNDAMVDRKYNSTDAVKARVARQMGMQTFLKDTKAI